MKSISLLVAALLVSVSLPASAESTQVVDETACQDWEQVAWSDLFAPSPRIRPVALRADAEHLKVDKISDKPKFKVEKFWVIGVN